MKNNQKLQSFFCKTSARLLAAGLACAAVLPGSPITSAPGSRNIPHDFLGSCGNTGTTEFGSTAESDIVPGDWEDGTDNGQGITPLNDDQTLLDITE